MLNIKKRLCYITSSSAVLSVNYLFQDVKLHVFPTITV